MGGARKLSLDVPVKKFKATNKPGSSMTRKGGGNNNRYQKAKSLNDGI